MVMRLRSRILQAYPLPRRPPHAGFYKNCGSSLALQGAVFIYTFSEKYIIPNDVGQGIHVIP